MNKLKPFLLLALVFFAGIAIGVAGTRIAVRHFVRQAIQHPEIIRGKIERDLTRKLRLDPQQRLKVREILIGSHDKLKSLRQEFRPRFVVIVQSAQDEISTVLTPEQQKKFEQLRTENAIFLQPR
jgi:hypothetical protein